MTRKEALLMTNTESARVLYARTRDERFAIGAFNVDNQETLIAIARAAAARKSPVLVEASHGEVEMIGLRNLRAMVDNYSYPPLRSSRRS
jgi:fructose-bisphosphate aldolase class II